MGQRFTHCLTHGGDMNEIDRLDYFAGLAMQACIMRYREFHQDHEYAEMAYALAQAMVNERKAVDMDGATKGAL